MANLISTNTIVGYFSTHAQAQSAVDALREAGFKASEVGLAARGGAQESGRASAASTDATDRNSAAYQAGKNAGEHVESAWEKIKNFFEGDIHPERKQEGYPSQEPYYEGFGPDEMNHSLAGLSVPEQNSRYFGHRFASDTEGAVVTVSAADRQAEAEAILRQQGADLGENAASYDYAGSNAENLSTQSADSSGETVKDSQNIRLYGEVLRVHKDRVGRGDVRLRKEVTTDTRTVQVPVTREELVIERNAVSGEQPADGATFKDQEIRIPLSEEKASVEKQPVVREEVRVGKRDVSSVQSVDEQVRHEELKVDDKTKTA